MIAVNVASAYLHDGKEIECNRVLGEYDWSACSENYKICVAALKKDVDETVSFMDTVIKGEMILKDSFRSWPVFDFVRDEKVFQDKFEEHFGEPLRREETKFGEAGQLPITSDESVH